MLKKSQIAVIGCGNLGGALIGGLLQAGLPAGRLRAADASALRRRELKKAYGIEASASNVEACRGADAIVLAVKPHIVAARARIAAGISQAAFDFAGRRSADLGHRGELAGKAAGWSAPCPIWR
jgi:pyrroline-5-carboxylate reductase